MEETAEKEVPVRALPAQLARPEEPAEKAAAVEFSWVTVDPAAPEAQAQPEQPAPPAEPEALEEPE
jgi:hypothetical protein